MTAKFHGPVLEGFFYALTISIFLVPAITFSAYFSNPYLRTCLILEGEGRRWRERGRETLISLLLHTP